MTTYVLNAIGTGIYGDSGSSGSTTAPFVGRETFPTDVSGVWTAGEFDAFWSFDLSGVHGTITGLTLRVPGFDYFGSDSWFDQLDFTLDGSELMNFWAVSASTSNLLGFPQGMAAPWGKPTQRGRRLWRGNQRVKRFSQRQGFPLP